MKQILTFILIILMSNSKLAAQISTVVETSGTTSSILLNGNDLYISMFTDSKITKFDITDNNPTIVDVANVCSRPTVMALKGNELYMTSFFDNKICKIDITATSPSSTLTDVVTGLGTTIALAFNGNDLYFTRDNGVISKIDITDTTPTIVDVIIGIPTDGIPRGLAFKGNDLYFSLIAGEILKFDTSAPNPSSTLTSVISGLIDPAGMAFKGNDLYIAVGYDGIGGRISKINITDATPTLTVVVASDAGLLSPRSLAFDGDDLYISDFNWHRVFKVSILPLSIEDIAPANALKIYPNPSNDYLQIIGTTKLDEFKIYNLLGAEVKHGFISGDKKIDIRNLTNGLYFLKFNDTEIIRFIKK